MGGQWKYCPKNHWTNKPKDQRAKYEKKRKAMPTKPFVSSYWDRIIRYPKKFVDKLTRGHVKKVKEEEHKEAI